MARLPDEMISRIKHEVSLIRLVEQSGIKLKKHGKDYIGHCPFHDQLRGQPGIQSVELLRCLRQRWFGHRLDNAYSRRELPPCGGVTA